MIDIKRTGQRTRENLEALKRLMTHDIIGSINDNVAAGNMTLVEGALILDIDIWEQKMKKTEQQLEALRA
ncbi:MAG: hypothetical protein MR868_08225 [Lachnospiraceae bacterium]|nr:hypothetical protein [Lachnospiraceae bacterium]